MTLGVLSLGDCVDPSVIGPLAPGQEYCVTSSNPDCPPGYSLQPGGQCALQGTAAASSTIIPGVPDIAVYTLGGILALFVFMGVKK